MAISIKKLDEKGNVSRYLVKDTSIALINAVRRSVMLHTPCLAIEDVSIYQNGSVLFDEMLAQRLGMLPVKTDKTYKPGDKVKLVLEKEGPCTVYSKDIKSTDPKIDITDKNIPITKLTKDQKIKIEMQAVMMSGEEHAKWQPAIVSYNEVPQFIVSKDCSGCNHCEKACPVKIIEIKDKKPVLKNAYKCTLCGACVDACEKEALKLGFDKGEYILTIEAVAGLSQKEAIDGATKAIIEKSKEFAKALQKLK